MPLACLGALWTVGVNLYNSAPLRLEKKLNLSNLPTRNLAEPKFSCLKGNSCLIILRFTTISGAKVDYKYGIKFA